MTADRLVMADGAALPLRRWLPTGRPRAAILALHGFNDYSNAFSAPAEYWATRGIATYAYDQRGFGDTPHRGRWPGEARLIEDLRTAARLVRARHPGLPFYLLGESMGGAVAMAAATGDDAPTADGLILVAPAVWGRETQGPLQSALLWLGAHTLPWLEVSGSGLDIQPSDNIEMLRALSRDPLVIKETRIDTVYGLVGLMDLAYGAAAELRQHALILYGVHEEVIPDSAAVKMLRRLPVDTPTRFALYRNGYHMLLRDLGAAVVHRDIAAWIGDGDRPLPSGADALGRRLLDSETDGFDAEAAATADGLRPGSLPAPAS